MQQAKTQTVRGKVADRIPQMAVANPDWFAVHIYCASRDYSLGDTACAFPLMSAIKPFSLLYLLELLEAETVFQWVGVEPSDAAFNSLKQLVADNGRPRNPMINSGAITLADKLPGKNALRRTQNLCQWLNDLAGCQLYLDEVMLASVRSIGSQTNHAIAYYLAQNSYINNLELAIDTYEHICSLSCKVEDLALLGKILAFESAIKSQNRQIVNALMLTCGLYEASAQLAVQVGIPMKSGISGALLGVIPGEGAIALYSPPLDSVGNSVAAIAFIETLSQNLQLSIFGNLHS